MSSSTKYAIVYFAYAPNPNQSVRSLKGWKSLLKNIAKASPEDEDRLDVFITGYAPSQTQELNAGNASKKIKRRKMVKDNVGKTGYMKQLNAEMIELKDPLLTTYDAVILIDHDIIFDDDAAECIPLKLGDRLMQGYKESQIGYLAPLQKEDSRHTSSLLDGSDPLARTSSSQFIIAHRNIWGVANGCVAVLPRIINSMCTRSLVGDLNMQYWEDDVFLSSRTIEYGYKVAIDKTCSVIHPNDDNLTDEESASITAMLLGDLEALRAAAANAITGRSADGGPADADADADAEAAAEADAEADADEGGRKKKGGRKNARAKKKRELN